MFVVLIDPCIPSPHLVTHFSLCSYLLYISISNISLTKTNVTRGLNDLQFIDDGRVKGLGIIFCLDPEGHFTVRVIGGGSTTLRCWNPQFNERSLTVFQIKKSEEIFEGDDLCHAAESLVI